MGDVSQKKVDELFNDVPYVFVIADDILIPGCDADCRDHDVRSEQVWEDADRLT